METLTSGFNSLSSSYRAAYSPHLIRPYSIGHEAVGPITALGPDITQFQVGDRVVIADGAVSSSSFTFHGAGSLGDDLGGCQAEYVRVPLVDSELLKMPPSVGNLKDADYVLMADIFPTAWQGLYWSGFEPGDSVVEFGAGPVGLLVAYSAVLRGASTVFSVDRVGARLKIAQSIGAVPIDLKDIAAGSAAEQILKQMPEGVNRVVDAVGFECVNAQLKPDSSYILQQAVQCLANGGGIGVAGVHGPIVEPSKGAPLTNTLPKLINFDMASFWFKNLTMRGGAVDVRELWPQLQTLIDSGRARPSFVFSNEVGIEGVPEAYRRFDHHEEVKVMVRFPWEFEGRREVQAENANDLQGQNGQHVAGDTDGHDGKADDNRGDTAVDAAEKTALPVRGIPSHRTPRIYGGVKRPAGY